MPSARHLRTLLTLPALPTLATLLAVAAAATGCSHGPLANATRAARTATGFASHVLCDEVFISGLPLQRAFDERIRPMPGQAAVVWALRPQLDLQRRDVRVSLAGGFESVARFSTQHGCQVLVGAESPAAPEAAPGPASGPPVAPSTNPAINPAANPATSPSPTPAPTLPPDPLGATVVPGSTARLQAALERALPQPADSHRTRAVVVLQHGRLVGERYAAGIGPDTPLLGFSASKSLTNALLGVLVQQGRLQVDRPGVLPAWAQSDDPHHAITLEHLLRQTAGLDLLQDNSGFDASAQIMYTVADKAAAAAAAPLAAAPGQRWAYADTNYLLLSRVLRDAVGGGAQPLQQFMQQALFGPLGMRRARLDLDATGTPVGAAHASATARDWARLGQLFLDDGVVDGHRLLPPGWVAWSTQPTRTPTQATGYGAGWWTNRQPGLVPGWGAPWGLPSAPADTFFARGFMGQFVVVVPSRGLVLVRLSSSHVHGDDIAETDRIVAEVLAAMAD